MIELASLTVYPVKSMAGFSPPKAAVHAAGLDGDRRWMLVDAQGVFLSQRSLPQLAIMAPRLVPGGLAIAAPGLGEIIAAPSGPPVTVNIWRDTVMAETCAPAVDAFLSRALGVACRLVHLSDPSRRALRADYQETGREIVAFADAFPLLLAAEESLAALNARLATPVCMNRFRPNLVVRGAPPWAEDQWRVIRIGTVRFRIAKPCDRCITTTVEQETGTRPDKTEPLRTLGAFRHTPMGVMFGQNLVPLDEGEIAAGMAVEVLDVGTSNVFGFDTSNG